MASNLAIGDALALGYGDKSGMVLVGKAKASMAFVTSIVPSGHFDTVLIGVGTYDSKKTTVLAVENLRNIIVLKNTPTKIIWIIPAVPIVRDIIMRVAKFHGDVIFLHQPSMRTHPLPVEFTVIS